MAFFLLISFKVCFSGFLGLSFASNHLLLVLISLELVVLSIDLNFSIFSVFLQEILGQIYILLMFTVAAAESSLGLAILVMYYSLSGGIGLILLNLLKS